MKKIFLFAAAVVAALTVNAENAVWNFSTWETGSGFTNQVKDNLGLYACAADAETQITNFGAINENSKTFDDQFAGTQRFQLNGGGYTSTAGFSATPTQRFVYFDVNGNSTIKVWYLTGGSGERTLYITDGTSIVGQNAHDGSSDKLIFEANYTGAAGKIFIFADKACNLYKIEASNVGTTSAFTPAGQGIINTNAAVKPVKRVVNGQVVIERDGRMFNLLGAEVK